MHWNYCLPDEIKVADNHKIFEIMKIIFISFIALSICSSALSQSYPGDNYDTLCNLYKYFFEEQASTQHIDPYLLPGYKDFLNSKKFFGTRVSNNGSIEEYYSSLNSYYLNNSDIINDYSLSWNYIGPEELWPKYNGQFSSNVGQGLIISLWADESDIDHILAGGNWSGGLWETTDGGNIWQNITEDERKIQAVSSIWVNPNDNNEIYLTTYSEPLAFSNGLFHRTYENGQYVWTQNLIYVNPYGIENGKNLYPNGSDWHKPMKFIKNSVNGRMYLLTCGRLYRSSDNGQHWDIILDRYYNNSPDPCYSPWAAKRVFADMEFDPVDNNVLYVTGPEAFRIHGLNTETLIVDDITNQLLSGSYFDCAGAIMVDAHDHFPNKIFFTINNKKIGNNGNDNKYVVVYNKQTQSYSNYSSSNLNSVNTFAGQLLQCEVNPLNENKVYLGGVAPTGFNLTTNSLIQFPYPGYGVGLHNDNRSAYYIDDGNNDILFLGTDGGLTKVVNFPSSGWQYIANDGTDGIRNLDIQGFDCSHSVEDISIIGTSHDGTAIRKNGSWFRIFNGGDYQTVLIDPINPEKIYITRYASTTSKKLEYSFDMGINVDDFFEYTNADYILPPILFFKPNDPSVLFAGEFKRLLKFNTNDLMEDPEVYTITGDNDDNSQNFREYGISDDLPNIFFLATDRWFHGWGNWSGYQNALFKVDVVSNEVLTFTDLTGNLVNGLLGGPITGIAIEIHPENIVTIWTSFGSTSSDVMPNLKKKVYYSNDLGQNWTPMANGLPDNIPVQDIQYDKRSGKLFLVNDVGIYLLDKANSTWINITGDLPAMISNKLRTSPIDLKIRVGSHGKGLWESDKPCFSNESPVTINTIKTWNCPEALNGNLIIETGGVLTITSELYVPVDCKIIVKRGGKLIIDGGTLTNACDGLWKGIEVWGTSNQSQSYTYQGAVEIINGGTIENAICGIQTIRYAIPDGGGVEAPDYSYTGGLVFCDNSNFINNETAVKFWPYNYSTSSSFFRDCEFITNNNLIPATDVKNFIEMKGISGVKIAGSSFTDSHSFTNPADLTSGVLANDSRFYVWPYNGQPSVFTGLYYGIKSLTVDPVKTVNIENSHFLNNFRSVYLSGISNATVILNQFNPWSAISIVANENYCLYLDGCTGYCIEENNFINPNTGIDNGIGMIINNSGTAENFIYNNYFSNLANAVLAQNDNRSITGVPGLQIKCNEFISNHSDIAVTLSSQFITATSGIAKYQGANQALPNAPAGNLFSHTGPPGTPSDINNAANHFTYYYHNNQFYPLQPWYFTANTVKISGVYGAQWNDQSCVSHLHHGGGGGGTGTIEDEQLLRQEMAIAELKTDSVQSVLQALEDGGSTEDLKWEVDLSVSPDAMEVYNELMNKSPYLSDTVVGSAIEKESVLVDAMIRDVMVANPQSAKSEELLQKLDERTNPVPEYMLGQILQGRNLVSTYEDLQSKLAFYSQQKAYLNKQLVRFYLNDTINPAVTDSIIALYSADNSLTAKYSLAFLLMEQGTGLSVLNAIPLQFTLSEEEMVAHQKMVDYYNLLTEVASGVPDSLQTEALFSIISTENGSASVYARNMLLALNAIEYNEPIILPDMLKSSEAIEYEKLLNTAKEVKYLEVIPNPVKDYAIISWNLDKEPMAAKITISGSLGNPVQEFSVTGIQDQKVVDTRNLKPGVYISTLYVDNRQIESVKFTIIK
jgi:hypothetical protein